MIVLDIEASGTEPHIHSILSLGALDLDEPTNQFYDECRAWEGAGIESDALAINGFTKEEATDSSKKTEIELVKAFIAWATDRPRNRTLAGQNPSFDRDFVKAACKRAGVEFPFAHRTIDTHTLVWLHMTEKGIPPPLEKHHSALDLDFAPLFRERFDLVVPQRFATDPLLAPLFDVMRGDAFRNAVSALPGYDVRRMGETILET